MNRKTAWTGLKFILVVAIIFYVIKENGGRRLISEMAGAHYSGILLSAVSFFLSIVLGSLQWHLLSRLQEIKVSFSSSFRFYYMGMFLNAVMFNLAGDALRVYKLKTPENQIATSVVSTFMDRCLGLCVLSFFSLISGTIIWQKALLPESYSKAIFLLSTLTFLAFLGVAAALTSRRLGALLGLVLNMMRLRKIENFYGLVKDSFLLYRKNWNLMLLIVCLAGLVHFLRIVGHYFCAVALGVDISLAYFFCFIPIISLVTLIPLNIGGWGLPQGISTRLYAIPGVVEAAAGYAVLNSDSLRYIAGSLTFLPAIIFYIIMLMGGFFFISNHSLNAKAPH